jgi:two-component system OmpR family sensor kinase
MKTRSIYNEFAKKLIFATSFFVIVLSLIFYGFTKSTIYADILKELIKDAKIIVQLLHSNNNLPNLHLLVNPNTTIRLVIKPKLNTLSFRQYTQNDNDYLELLYPFELSEHKFLLMTRNINSANQTLNKIFSNLLFLGFGGLVLVVAYALAVSKTLLLPILRITNKLSNMNENSLTQIETKTLPKEFISLANSINTLTNRIESYVKYQKELFIGAAHELKTPLAVMKLKSQVTLQKQRTPQKYEEVLNILLKEIDNMNNLISSILDMGRQEGAQFEKPIEIDIVQYLRNKTKTFQLLAKEKNINLEFKTDLTSVKLILQETLLTQIIQNFVQNAIKFTPEGKNIFIKAYKEERNIIIQVIDEGIGCDENIDLFAPFKRVGNQKGAGLGLFLAKSASDTLGGKITLKNRTDGIQGTIATLILQQNPFCEL